MNERRCPPGSAYAVTLWADSRTAFFTSIEGVVACLLDRDIALECEVTRVSDNTMVWPIHTWKGQA